MDKPSSKKIDKAEALGLKDRKVEITKQLESLKRQLRDNQKKHSEMRRDEGELEKKLNSIMAQNQKSKHEINQNRQRLMLLQSQLQKNNDQIDKKAENDRKIEETRVLESTKKLNSALQDLKNTQTPYGSISQLMNPVPRQGNFILKPLYRLIEMKDKRYAKAIEAALGSKLFAICVDTDTQARVVLEKATKSVEILNAEMICEEVPKLPEMEGLTMPKQVVSIDPYYKKVFEYCLGRVVICDTEELALQVMERDMIGVTLDGEIYGDGSITGGTSFVPCWDKINQIQEIQKRLQENEMKKTRLEAEHQVYKKRIEDSLALRREYDAL